MSNTLHIDLPIPPPDSFVVLVVRETPKGIAYCYNYFTRELMLDIPGKVLVEMMDDAADDFVNREGGR